MKRIKTYKVFETAESEESVEDICLRYGIRNWTLNDDGTVDVDGSVILTYEYCGKLPLKFGRVTGDFGCSYNNLTNLEGCPTWVGGDFRCSYNRLTSLEGGPEEVCGEFICQSNELNNLEFCPKIVGGNFWCTNNNIISLEYYPNILTGRIFLEGNPVDEIWGNVQDIESHLSMGHGHYLDLFDLHGPIQFEGGQWVCHVFRLNNFYEEIGATHMADKSRLEKKLKYYKEV